MDALKAAGFRKNKFISTCPNNDIPGAFDAADSMLVQHPEVKHCWALIRYEQRAPCWAAYARRKVRAFKAADIIGIGINGVDAVSELSKAQATGFYGSLLPSPDVHGYS
ncbi:hypothetical protein ACLB1R_06715 [Escherichia coli]